jgi:hypothetical protein
VTGAGWTQQIIMLVVGGACCGIAVTLAALLAGEFIGRAPAAVRPSPLAHPAALPRAGYVPRHRTETRAYDCGDYWFEVAAGGAR